MDSAGARTAMAPVRRAHRAGFSILAIILAASEANAAGYALKEQSASGLGNAFAGSTAGAEDISVMFFNPAGLTRHSGSQILPVASYVMPQVKFKNGEASTVAGTPITGGNGGSNAGDSLLVPALYGLWDLDETFGSGHKLRLGLGVNVPFGLETDYSDGWIGRYYALHSKLETVNINPAVAFEVLDGLSFGAGLQIQYIDATLTNAIDFGTIGAASGVPFAVPTLQDGRARVTGDDWGYGFTLGTMLEPWQGTRFGVGYRSQIKQHLSGNASFRLDDAGVGAAISSATGAFTNTGAKANVTTPEMLNFGVYHELSDQWAIMGEAQWTRWSRFKDLTIKFANPAQPDSVTQDDWNDSWFFAFGVTYRPTPAWALRAGYAYDQSPVPNRTRTPRIPDNDRQWLAIGASYRLTSNLSFSLGYTHIFVRDASINLSASDQGSTFRGNLEGNTENAIDIVTAQGKWTF